MSETILITGANRGIGLEMARQLQARGDTVLAACRHSSGELDRLGCKVITGIDVASDSSVSQLAGRLEGTDLDVIVNNAGVFEPDALGSIDFESMRRQYEVNALGPLRVTQALLPRLRDGGKIAIITSRVGSMADNSSGHYYGYRASKAAVNMIGVNLALELRERGITVLLLHPGMVATEMTGRTGIEPSESAQNLLRQIDALGIEHSGSFRHANGEVLPW